MLNNQTGHNSILDEFSTEVFCLSWMNSGTALAIGFKDGTIKLYDTIKKQLLRTINGHLDLVSALNWNEYLLSSGSRDSKILNHDVRIKSHLIYTCSWHKKGITSLKWSEDKRYLATGAFDNKVCIWDIRKNINSTNTVHELDHDSNASNASHTLEGENIINKTNTITNTNSNTNINNIQSNNNNNVSSISKYNLKHNSVIRGLSWSPHDNNLLATGGGTKDPSIKIWDISNGKLIKVLNTKAQICSLLWSKNTNEIITAHGGTNNIELWKYPSMKHLKSFKGHSNKILHLAISPDGTTIASGAGSELDETLRLWKMFDKNESKITLVKDCQISYFKTNDIENREHKDNVRKSITKSLYMR